MASAAGTGSQQGVISVVKTESVAVGWRPLTDDGLQQVEELFEQASKFQVITSRE